MVASGHVLCLACVVLLTSILQKTPQLPTHAHASTTAGQQVWLLCAPVAVGVVKSIKAPGEKHHHLSTLSTPDPNSMPADPAVVPDAVDVSAVPVDARRSDPELVMVDSLEGGIPEKGGRVAEGALLKNTAGNVTVQQLRQVLAEREAEVHALKQQLDQLSAASPATTEQ